MVKVIGIDATNIRGGGGLTHLVELLESINLTKTDFDRVVIWGGASVLKKLNDRPWLIKRNPSALNKGLLKRVLWQYLFLSKAAVDELCTVLFVPGGSYAGSFHPVVTMSQNLLPFEMNELLRYGWTLFTPKLLLLRLIQSRTFKNCEGVIFLTEYARKTVLAVTGNLLGRTCIIPHGLSPRFNLAPKPQKSLAEYDDSNPYRILYVSIIDEYKHQWHVVRAVAALRKKGWPIAIDLVGPAYQPALKRLNAVIDSTDARDNWVHYHGSIPFEELHSQYARADLGIFASSCENMPNILLEMMSSGLPIACSNRGPMPEILLDSGVYFDPESVDQILSALLCLIKSPRLRTQLSEKSYSYAWQYSWTQCVSETFNFINEVALKYRKNN